MLAMPQVELLDSQSRDIDGTVSWSLGKVNITTAVNQAAEAEQFTTETRVTRAAAEWFELVFHFRHVRQDQSGAFLQMYS